MTSRKRPGDSLASPPKRRLRPLPATCPDPGSLYDVIRRHSGESLFALPIVWTESHRRLLHVDFVQQQQSAPTAAATRGSFSAGSRSQTGPSAVAQALSTDLSSLLSRETSSQYFKARALKSVLSTLFPSVFSRPRGAAEFDLHFGRRFFRCAVRVPLVWRAAEADLFQSSQGSQGNQSGPSGPSGPAGLESTRASLLSSLDSLDGSPRKDGPMVAYLNRAQLLRIRQTMYRIVPDPVSGDRENGPVRRLQILRSKRFMPSDLDRDPFLIGVFLTMAQAHFYERPAVLPSQGAKNRGKPAGPPQERRPPAFAAPLPFHDVPLRILSHDDETSEFVVYRTTVKASFLERFAAPATTPALPLDFLHSVAVARDAGMHIIMTRVPMWPILGLRERLGTALGADLVGRDLQDDDNLFGRTFDDATSIATLETQEIPDEDKPEQKAAAEAAAETPAEVPVETPVETHKAPRPSMLSSSQPPTPTHTPPTTPPLARAQTTPLASPRPLATPPPTLAPREREAPSSRKRKRAAGHERSLSDSVCGTRLDGGRDIAREDRQGQGQGQGHMPEFSQSLRSKRRRTRSSASLVF